MEQTLFTIKCLFVCFLFVTLYLVKNLMHFNETFIIAGFSLYSVVNYRPIISRYYTVVLQ